jgi:hypothetical protein
MTKQKGAISLATLLTTMGISFTVFVTGIGYLVKDISENADKAQAHEGLITENKIDIAVNQTEIYTTQEDVTEIKTDVKEILNILRK